MPLSSDLCTLTARSLCEGYAQDRFTPLDVLAAVEARLDDVNQEFNAVIAENRKQSRAAALAATQRWRSGSPLSPLDGIPMSIKDNLHVADLPAAWGSRIHRHCMPQIDEPPVARLRAAGAVMIGKTNVPEFTLQGFTGNAAFGVTRNPLAPDRTPGGSTGGGAAAVAAGIGPIAIGTDGGGSLRRPAAHCGLFGFKPSLGQIARSGGFPQILADFEVVGPIARCADDLQAVFNVLRGTHSCDPRSLSAQAAARAFSPRPRAGFFNAVGAAPIDRQITEAAETFAVALENDGCIVDRIDAPFDIEDVHANWSVIAHSGLAWYLAGYASEADQIGDNAREMMNSGIGIPATDYVSALARCIEIRTSANLFLEEFDFLVCPSAAALAWPAEDAFPPFIDGKPAGPRGHSVFTTWMNVAGLCAASVPVGLTRDAGGIGMQLVSAVGRDRELLDFVANSVAIANCNPASTKEESPI